ncbi:MAG: methyltransferase domain-containing protein [bacterium]
MKLNFGSNNKKIEGFLNVDALPLENVDVVCDFNEAPYPFDNDSAVEILAIELLEHLSYKSARIFLNECFRILKPGGEFIVQVPNIGEMCRMYTFGQVCSCVPHKAIVQSDFKADKNCPECSGAGRINPQRWKFAFSGAQKHEFDFHLSHWTGEILKKEITAVGFSRVQRIDHIYKLI